MAMGRAMLRQRVRICWSVMGVGLSSCFLPRGGGRFFRFVGAAVARGPSWRAVRACASSVWALLRRVRVMARHDAPRESGELAPLGAALLAVCSAWAHAARPRPGRAGRAHARPALRTSAVMVRGPAVAWRLLLRAALRARSTIRFQSIEYV